ncbi:MAG: hypothetical protein ACD_56C00123G0008 [uncultured bacterium]|nr:MAG: hypothetical protein ACD_56C00123G0008 [uncultured bacterium]
MDFYAMQMTPRKKDDDRDKREENLKKNKRTHGDQRGTDR